jgi:hypothetical protein
MKTIQNAVTLALVLLVLIVVLLALTLSAVAQLHLGRHSRLQLGGQARLRMGGATPTRNRGRITGGNLEELRAQLRMVQEELDQQRKEQQSKDAETASVHEQLAANTDKIRKAEENLEEYSAALKKPNGELEEFKDGVIEFVQQHKLAESAHSALLAENRRLDASLEQLQIEKIEADTRISKLENSLEYVKQEIESAHMAEADRANEAIKSTDARLARQQTADDEKDRDDVKESLGVDAEDAAAVYHKQRKLRPFCDYTIAADCASGLPTVKQSWQHEQRAGVNLAIEAASIQCAASIADAPAYRSRAGRLFAVVPAAAPADPLRARQLFAERAGQRLPAAATNSVGTNSVGTNSVGTNSVGTNSVGTNSVGTNSSYTANTRGAKTQAAALALVHVYELQRAASGCIPSLLTSFRA